MKKLFTLTITSFVFLVGCQTETEILKEDDLLDLQKTTITNNNRNSFEYPSNEIVIQYDASLSEAEKQLMRDEYEVISYKKCTCADPTLELWYFSDRPQGGANGTIEEKLISLKEDDGLEGASFNPFIKQQGQYLQDSFGPQSLDFANTKIKENNTGVTIAVLDTGIDYNYFNFNIPFLYNAVINDNECQQNNMQDFYGWDFVNQDNDPFDDYGHGTIVSNIVFDKLQEENIDFQILPIKVFNEEGDGAYFDILCGFKYAANNRDVNIINMSFGWYNVEYDLLQKFILESQRDKLLVTSAGNIGVSTDIYPHFPSNYETPNLLSIAALSSFSDSVGLAPFSNFGTQSVDLAAQGDNIPFYISTSESILVSGTSFAAAYTSAFAGALYVDGITVPQHISFILDEMVYSPELSMLKYSSYIDF